MLERQDELFIHSAIDVPTRALALLQEPGGTLLAVAYRPGALIAANGGVPTRPGSAGRSLRSGSGGAADST